MIPLVHSELKIALTVLPVPVLQDVVWAERPEDIPPWDWTRGYSPVQPLSRFGEDYDLDTPEEEVDRDHPLPSWLKLTKFYPRLVRKWASSDIWEPSPESNLPPKASVSPLEAFQRVYRALQQDQDPLQPDSLTRKTIGEMARKAGILSSFEPDWRLSGEGVWGRFSGANSLLRDDSLWAWVEAAYFFQTVRLALKLREESNLPPKPILQRVIQELGFPLEVLEENGQAGVELRVRPAGDPLEGAKRRGLDIALEYLGRGRSLRVSGLENVLREEATRHVVLEPVSKFETHTPIRAPRIPLALLKKRSEQVRKQSQLDESWKEWAQELREIWEEWVQSEQEGQNRRAQSAAHYFGFMSLIDLGLLQLLRRDYVACEWCGKVFSPRRRDTRYCSDVCRMKAWRNQRASSKHKVE
ncbi:hypothetical protein TCCBUS3UF1_620 [Thermus sp. CCB_US3_UF1]|uniref:zinc finger MYND domain-containing protein n=1 Tax=Thermus sp. CCB_US3_UF1 TaxID=1111069 RepID=UPI000238A2B5|nr:zinc finger MYND domain-containing protein [Thermus sp. CCB_US3_UF1]AEV15112.1 hypothetical protein TCCBUS3UF1_620 [Thermus sp. CCB_US3_UF1]